MIDLHDFWVVTVSMVRWKGRSVRIARRPIGARIKEYRNDDERSAESTFPSQRRGCLDGSRGCGGAWPGQCRCTNLHTCRFALRLNYRFLSRSSRSKAKVRHAGGGECADGECR